MLNREVSKDCTPAGVGVRRPPLDLEQKAPTKAKTDDAAPSIFNESRSFQLIVQAADVLNIE